MQSIRQITVDLQRNDVLVPIYAKQYDANTRAVELPSSTAAPLLPCRQIRSL